MRAFEMEGGHLFGQGEMCISFLNHYISILTVLMIDHNDGPSNCALLTLTISPGDRMGRRGEKWTQELPRKIWERWYLFCFFFLYFSIFSPLSIIILKILTLAYPPSFFCCWFLHLKTFAKNRSRPMDKRKIPLHIPKISPMSRDIFLYSPSQKYVHVFTSSVYLPPSLVRSQKAWDKAMWLWGALENTPSRLLQKKNTVFFSQREQCIIIPQFFHPPKFHPQGSFY